MGNRLVTRLSASAVPAAPAQASAPAAEHHLGAPATQSEVTVVDDLGNFKRMDSRKVRQNRCAGERAARTAAVITSLAQIGCEFHVRVMVWRVPVEQLSIKLLVGWCVDALLLHMLRLCIERWNGTWSLENTLTYLHT